MKPLFFVPWILRGGTLERMRWGQLVSAPGRLGPVTEARAGAVAGEAGASSGLPGDTGPQQGDSASPRECCMAPHGTVPGFQGAGPIRAQLESHRPHVCPKTGLYLSRGAGPPLPGEHLVSVCKSSEDGGSRRSCPWKGDLSPASSGACWDNVTSQGQSVSLP